MSIDRHDHETVRCPKLGDFVPFKYCRTCGRPFCWTVIECWAPKIDIGQFLADNYDPDTIYAGLKRPEGGRVRSMLDACERYRSD